MGLMRDTTTRVELQVLVPVRRLSRPLAVSMGSYLFLLWPSWTASALAEATPCTFKAFVFMARLAPSQA